LETWAQEIVDRFKSYSEFSPSGEGVHILIRGALPPGRRRVGQIEMYDAGRYFTMTGHVLNGHGRIENRGDELIAFHREVFPQEEGGGIGGDFGEQRDADVLERARNAANGAKFDRLWRGNYGEYPSQSEGDLALCSLLVFWTDGDLGQADRLFRQSGLFRPKWDEPHAGNGQTYGQITLQKALQGMPHREQGEGQREKQREEAGDEQAAGDFDISALSNLCQKLLSLGWDSDNRYCKRFRNRAAAAMFVAGEMLRAGASKAQVRSQLKISLVDSPGLLNWVLKRAAAREDEQGDAREVASQIVDILTERGRDQEDRQTPRIIKLQNASRVLLKHLNENGFMVYDPLSLTPYYMDELTHTLYRLDSPVFLGWLHSLTTINPALPDFKALFESVKTEALLRGEHCSVVHVAQWDENEQVLRVSRYDGTLYKLDGQSITTEPNGSAGVLFEDDPSWQPYEPDFAPTVEGEDATGRALAWTLNTLPKWEEEPEICTLTLRAWLFSTFFPEALPTRPMLVLVGEKGSGKSLTLRIFLRMLFGPAGELSGVPDKPDGFTCAAAAQHILALDNLDSFEGWLRDKIARITTGSIDTYRVLYTSNTMGRVLYRCYLAATTRTPDTLQRDDIADRLLILSTERVEEPEAESSLLKNAAVLRNAWWGDLLTALNQVVLSIRNEGMPNMARLRMADFECLAQVVARTCGQTGEWERAVEMLQARQSELLLEGDPIVEALSLWLGNKNNHGREMLTRELYTEFTEALFEDKEPERNWPQTHKGFSRKLLSIRRDLQTRFRIQWKKGTGRELQHLDIYQFWPKTE
jgi:hypothetical protein